MRAATTLLILTCPLIATGQQEPAPLRPLLLTAGVAPIESPEADPFSERLTALELALSTIVAEKPGLWRFEPLETEASALLLLARSEQERQAVRDLAQRMDRFAAIAARYRQMRETRATTAVAGAPTAPKVAPPVRLTKAREASNDDYDAVGTLRPVVSKRLDAPRYAIVSDEGRLLTLVSPGEVDRRQLDRLLGSRIGLSGVRGYRTDLRREHLTAERITPLNTVLR